MKQYEISNNGKYIGKINLHKENIKDNIKNTLIETPTNLTFKFDKTEQTYELSFIVNDIDALFNIVSKYINENDKIFETIEEIKKYNNISLIKSDTNINILIPEICLSNFNKTTKDCELHSFFNSKIHFIKKVIENKNQDNIINELNNIIAEYNNYINSNEFEFFTDIEKEDKIRNLINRVDKIIYNIEQNTNYKYGINFIIPIKIKMN